MLKTFLNSWLIYWIIYVILPVHSVFPSVLEATLLQIIFVFLVCFGYMLPGGFGVKKVHYESKTRNIWCAKKITYIALWLSLIGLLSILYDKLFVQGIDYLAGLAAARQQWRVLGEERLGQASSIFSVLGYFFGSAYYVSLCIVFGQSEIFSEKERIVLVIAVFIFVVLNSILTGGRSNILLIIAFGIASIKSQPNQGLKKIFPKAMYRNIFLGVLIIAFIYTIFIFFDRAAANDLSISEYVSSAVYDLGFEFNEEYHAILPDGMFRSIFDILTLELGYLVHSLGTFSAIIDAPSENKTILFYSFNELMYKAHILSKPDGDWFLAGSFPSVPGAAWYQYGPLGFCLFSFSIGITGAIAKMMMNRYPRSLFGFSLYIMTFTTLILTPYVFALDILSFPFVFISFMFISFIQAVIMIFKNQSFRYTC